MKETANLAFNYKLKKDEVKKTGSKVYPNRHFATFLYPTYLFYKNITRFFVPVETNEK
jgi:hypothetical protein